MNWEYRSSGLYMASSCRFSEYDLLELAQVTRELAQYSVTRFMRFYDFLKDCQQNPFIYQGLPFHDISGFSADNITQEILFDFRDRNYNIYKIENIAMTINNIKTKLFIEKIKSLYIDEAELLLSSFKDDVFSNKLRCELCRLSEVVLI
jgi:ferritin